MKSLSLTDCEKVLSKLEKLQKQSIRIRHFVERKIGCTLEEANVYYDFDNEFFKELLSIDGSIEGTIENVFNV